MENIDLLNLWKSSDKKLEEILTLNKEIIQELTKERAVKTILTLRRFKSAILFISIPYALLLYGITYIGYKAEAIFVTLGFGAIALITTAIVVGYFYHLYLIDSINRSQEIIKVQRQIARLRLSSFNILRVSLLQIPLWGICWMSVDALRRSPFMYGGLNLFYFIGAICLSYWLFKSLGPHRQNSKVRAFFISGAEWEPIQKASEILDQLHSSK